MPVTPLAFLHKITGNLYFYKGCVSKLDILAGILIPFIGTMSGSAMVFLMKNKINGRLEKLLPGFASGVMLAAAIWSLIMPAIEMSENMAVYTWFPAAAGFMAGIIFLIFLDNAVPHMRLDNDKPEGPAMQIKKSTMLALTVTFHNIPEGMAVGVALAGALSPDTGITMASALTLATGIAIQNFPEGAIISMPLENDGMPKIKAFIYGAMSGIVEPAGAIITILLTGLVVPVLPYLLAFAAGAMFYVVVEELIPEAQSDGSFNIGTIGVAAGFVAMMVLDVAF